MAIAKRVAAATLALAALAASAAPVGATEITISPAGEIAASSNGRLTFTDGSIRFTCPITFWGELRSGPIRAASGESLGTIETGAKGVCEGGEIGAFLVEAGRPWTLAFERFLGTAPNSVTGFLVSIRTMAIRWSVLGEFVECLYAGAVGALISLRTTRTAGVYTTDTGTYLSTTLSLVSGTFCPSSKRLSGTFVILPHPQTITVR